MDFTKNWGGKIRDRLQALHFSATILEPRSHSTKTFFDPIGLLSLRQNLDALDSIGPDDVQTATPCTNCYNSKILALKQYLDELRISRVVFAHHATDSVSSFLKSALMYMDRWDQGNERYDRDRFHRLVKVVHGQLHEHPAAILDRLSQLADAGVATTDEPPVQRLVSNMESPLIVRPLSAIWESEIMASKNANSVPTEPSGCAHSLSPSTQTPRELIQFTLTQNWEATGISTTFLELIERNIDSNGFALNDARSRRTEILGLQYKPAKGGLEKL